MNERVVPPSRRPLMVGELLTKGRRDAGTTRLCLLLLMLFIAEAAMACPVCYGDPNSPMVKGTNSGILFLLGVVGLLWIGFAALFISFYMRARAIRRRREEFHLIHGGVH